MKKLRVTVDGKVYEVLVEMLVDETAPAVVPPAPVALVATAAVPPSAPTPKSASVTVGPGDVVSPLAGKVVSIEVQLGQTVVVGAQVATIEAMKMNTHIFAPKAGRVSEVLVNPGDGVDEGHVLLRVV